MSRILEVSSDNPMVSLTHGRGLDERYWTPFQNELAERGFSSIALSLPVEEGAFTLAQLAKIIKSEERRLKAERIIRVGHSWGGNPIVREITEEVVELFFSVAVFDRSSVVKKAQEKIPLDRVARHSVYYPATTASDPKSRADLFLHDVSRRKRKYAHFRDHPHLEENFDQGLPSRPEVPMRYSISLEDRSVPVEVQKLMAEAAGAQARKEDEMPTGHMPMLADPSRLADILVAPWIAPI